MTPEFEFIYKILCKVDMTVLPSTGRVINTINTMLEEVGSREKIEVWKEGEMGNVTTNRPMTDEEQAQYITALQSELNKSDVLNKFTVTGLQIQSIRPIAGES